MRVTGNLVFFVGLSGDFVLVVFDSFTPSRRRHWVSFMYGIGQTVCIVCWNMKSARAQAQPVWKPRFSYSIRTIAGNAAERLRLYLTNRNTPESNKGRTTLTTQRVSAKAIWPW